MIRKSEQRTINPLRGLETEPTTDGGCRATTLRGNGTVFNLILTYCSWGHRPPPPTSHNLTPTHHYRRRAISLGVFFFFCTLGVLIGPSLRCPNTVFKGIPRHVLWFECALRVGCIFDKKKKLRKTDRISPLTPVKTATVTAVQFSRRVPAVRLRVTWQQRLPTAVSAHRNGLWEISRPRPTRKPRLVPKTPVRRLVHGRAFQTVYGIQ